MTRRYLRYDECRPAARGINHMLANLQCLLREAHASGRLAVLPTLRLAAEHNFGVAREWCWDNYFDLAGSRLVDADGTVLPLPLVAAVPADVGAPVHLAPRASLTDRAARATLVARHMRRSVHRRDVPRRCRPYVGFRMRPSARVRSLAAPVVAALRGRGQGDFAAVHVRRGDRLAAPWLRRLVAPPRIVRRLRRSGVPAGTVVFVLADEDVADLSASLAAAFAPASRADFAALSALVAGPEPDNYLLYEVEKEVMRAAGVRIETHPGPRIDVSARSTDPHATLIPRSAWLLHRLFGKLRDARWVPGRLWARAQARLGSRRITSPSGPAGEGGRYLRYDEVEPVQRGINHLTRNLEVLLREAHLLGRVAVLPALHLAPKHNFGVDRQWWWETYYDFDGSRLVDASGKSHPLPLAAAPPSRCSRALVVAAGERVPGSATGHPLIVRRITRSVFGKEVRFAAVGPPDFRFRPSPRVRQLARRVVSELRRRGGGSFHAVHVRRGDRLFGPMRWLTRPQRVRARLRAVDVPDGAVVYLLSDERVPAFWDRLAVHYQLVRFGDFAELRGLVSATAPGGPDNYLLYSVEKQVMRGATLRIETFPGAEYEPADATLVPPAIWTLTQLGGRWSQAARRLVHRVVRGVVLGVLGPRAWAAAKRAACAVRGGGRRIRPGQ